MEADEAYDNERYRPMNVTIKVPVWFFKPMELEVTIPDELIKPNEAARAIAWMASSESGMMTGSLIDFDQSVLGAGDVSRPEPGEMGTF